MDIPSISASRLRELLDSQQTIQIVDVRTPVEFREVHLPQARNLPLDRLTGDITHRVNEILPRGSGDTSTVYLLCRTGKRAQDAGQRLIKAGYQNVALVEGGTDACEKAGLTMVHGKKAISLERQVRIAAGSLVLLGALLGWFVHPAFIGLSAFVGAGLIFAGLTDTCGMGLLLAKMPWNRVKPKACEIER